MRFSGRAELSDGACHDVEVGLGVPGISLLVEGFEVGTWPADACSVVELAPDEYRIEVDDDYFLFTPVDPERFRCEAGSEHPASGPLRTAVAERAVPETLPEAREPAVGPLVDEESRSPDAPEPQALPSKVPRWAVIAGVAAVLAVLVLAAVSLPGNGEGGEQVILTTTTTSAAEIQTSIFEAAPASFVAVWNSTAQALGASLPVTAGPGAFEQEFSPFLRLEWQTDDAGTLDGYQVVVDTTGTGESGRQGLAALGVAISVADPTLDAAGRRSVLTDLGYDVTNPALTALDGEAEVNGVRYSLRYVPEFSTLLFSVGAVAS
ncbi:MAG: hypothetical protein R6X29_03405 [Acidimicrobiia bacterium]|jgi:hypothetical protein